MLKLIYDDLIDKTTFTFKTMDKQKEEIESLEKKLNRMKEFDLMLTNYLQTYKEIDFKSYSHAVALLERSDLTVSEIFKKIHKQGLTISAPWCIITLSNKTRKEVLNMRYKKNINTTATRQIWNNYWDKKFESRKKQLNKKQGLTSLNPDAIIDLSKGQSKGD